LVVVVAAVVVVLLLWRISLLVVTSARMVGGCKYGDQAKLLMTGGGEKGRREAENVASESACLAATTP
jgi:hypothetical protein